MPSIRGAGVVMSSGGRVLLLDLVVSRGQLSVSVVLLVPSGGTELRQQVLFTGLVALGVGSGGVLLLGHGHSVAGSGGVPEQRVLHCGAEATSRPAVAAGSGPTVAAQRPPSSSLLRGPLFFLCFFFSSPSRLRGVFFLFVSFLFLIFFFFFSFRFFLVPPPRWGFPPRRNPNNRRGAIAGGMHQQRIKQAAAAAAVAAQQQQQLMQQALLLQQQQQQQQAQPPLFPGHHPHPGLLAAPQVGKALSSVSHPR